MRVGFVGCGLIGTSLALLVRRSLPDCSLFVFEPNAAYATDLAEILPGARIVSALAEIGPCDVIFVCAPTAAIGALICALIPACREQTHIIDVGSVKSATVADVWGRYPAFERFIPGHPLAGNTLVGPRAATLDTLDRKPFVITPYEATSADATAFALHFLQKIGLRTYQTDSRRHDRFVALTSHLTHILAFSLVERLFDLFKDERNSDCALETSDMAYFTGGSFLGMTRFAESDPAMWTDIFQLNLAYLKREAADFTKHMDELLVFIDRNDKSAIKDRLLEIKRKREMVEAAKDGLEKS